MSNYDIFISYRRKDNGQRKARRLANSLTEKGFNVFFDMHSLKQGEYRKDIEAAITSSTDFIMLMTEGYMDRCVNTPEGEEGDVVAFEILTAIRNNKNIVMLNYNDKFSFDTWPEGLCPELDNLKNHNSLSFPTNDFYDGPIKKLVDTRLVSKPNSKPSLWEDYKNSDEGKLAISDFEKLQSNDITAKEFSTIINKYTENFQLNFEDSDKIDYERLFEAFQDVNFDDLNISEYVEDNCVSYLVNLYGNELDQTEFDLALEDNIENIHNIDLKHIYYGLPDMSSILYRYNPECFIPFFFTGSMNKLIDICEINGITMPEDPKRQKYNDRALYYVKFCQQLTEYRIEKGMTPAELCAFLYGYNKEEIDIEDVDDLPAPSNVWFVGGTNDALEGLATYKLWQCNIEAKKGDVLVFYEKAPVQSLTSIWRAHTDCFVEPYAQYYSFVYAGSPINVPAITKAELDNDEYFKNHKLVRKNMQGVSGWPMSSEDYQHYLKLLEAKGADITKLPQISFSEEEDITAFGIEKISKVGGGGILINGHIYNGYFSDGEEVRFISDDSDAIAIVVSVLNSKKKPIVKKIKDGEELNILFNESELKDIDLNEFTMIVKKASY